jgi:hypothetical protein
MVTPMTSAIHTSIGAMGSQKTVRGVAASAFIGSVIFNAILTVLLDKDVGN